MNPSLAKRLRRALRGAAGARQNRNGAPTQKRQMRESERTVSREVASEFSMEELQEFLEGDLHPSLADPDFKAKLRNELWEMVQARYGQGPKKPSQEE